MLSGRTKPCVFICEEKEGDPQCEYVVKLKAGIENGPDGLVAELIASQLASFLDIPTPMAALVNIDPIMGDTIADPAVLQKIRKSVGLNFGSQVITGGFDTWPKGKSVPVGLLQTALEIFAFDAMVQNPDRRSDKPNVLWNGERLYIIDHEMSFSFVYDKLTPMKPEPWEASKLRFMSEHIFFTGLKGREIKLERFIGAIDTLSEKVMNEILSAIPDEWHGQYISEIKAHIMAVAGNINRFSEEIRRLLL